VCRPENKDQAWKDFVEGKKYSQTPFSHAAVGFSHWTQRDIWLPYADKFFEVVEEVFENTHRDYAARFFCFLSPAWLGREEDLLKLKQLL